MTSFVHWLHVAVSPFRVAPCSHPSTYKRPGTDGRDYITCRTCGRVLYTVPSPKRPGKN